MWKSRLAKQHEIQTAGIAVIRIPKNPSLPLLESLIRQFLHALNTTSISNQLWIIEVGRIRVHQSEADEERGL